MLHLLLLSLSLLHGSGDGNSPNTTTPSTPVVKAKALTIDPVCDKIKKGKFKGTYLDENHNFHVVCNQNAPLCYKAFHDGNNPTHHWLEVHDGRTEEEFTNVDVTSSTPLQEIETPTETEDIYETP